MGGGGGMTAVTLVSARGVNNSVVATSVYGVLFLLGVNYWVISVRAHRDIVLH